MNRSVFMDMQEVKEVMGLSERGAYRLSASSATALIP